MRVMRTPAFAKWYQGLDGSIKARVLARLIRVETEGHFGEFKALGENVSEMKFSSALRVYYTLRTNEAGETCICLLGGEKNGQSSDIAKAKKLAKGV